MRLYLRLLAALAAVCMLATAGCGCGEGKRRPAEEGPKIGFSIADEERDGSRAIKKVVEARARRDNVRLMWADAGGDPERQEQDIREMIKENVAAVVLQLVDPPAGPGMVRRLAMNKIKVVALETLPADAPVDGFVASEHAAAGKLLARYVVDHTPPGAATRAVILSGDENDPMAQGIVEAIRAGLEGTGWTLQVQDHPGGDPSKAGTTVDKVLTEGVPGAFLATDSRMAVAAVEKLRMRGLLEKVLTAGVGADRTAAEALVAGDHDAEVDVMPEQLGQFAYEAALGLARDGRWQYDSQTMNGDFGVPTRITPVRLIEAEDAFLLEERFGDLTRAAGREKEDGGQGGTEEKSEESGGGGGGKDEQQPQPPMTKLTITTQDGKTVEIDVPGEVQSIETQQTGGGQSGGGQGGRGGGGGGSGDGGDGDGGTGGAGGGQSVGP